MRLSLLSASCIAGMFSFGCQGTPVTSEDGSALVESHARSLEQTLAQPTDASAGYTWPVPPNWFTETWDLPPPWDPSYPFSGIEDLRFSPGFPDPTQADWWAYGYLQWIDAGPKVTASLLESALVGYYKGLSGCGNTIECDMSWFGADIRRIVHLPNVEVFTGTVDMYDVVATPIELNVVISSTSCPRAKHRALLVSASPQPLSHPIWRDLLKLQLDFRCR